MGQITSLLFTFSLIRSNTLFWILCHCALNVRILHISFRYYNDLVLYNQIFRNDHRCRTAEETSLSLLYSRASGLLWTFHLLFCIGSTYHIGLSISQGQWSFSCSSSLCLGTSLYRWIWRLLQIQRRSYLGTAICMPAFECLSN